MQILKTATSRRLALVFLEVVSYFIFCIVCVLQIIYGYNLNILVTLIGLAISFGAIQKVLLGRYTDIYVVAPLSETFDEDDERDTHIKNTYLRFFNRLNEIFIFSFGFILIILSYFTSTLPIVFIALYLSIYKVIIDLGYLIYFSFRNHIDSK